MPHGLCLYADADAEDEPPVSAFDGARCLATGGAGFIGSNLTRCEGHP